MAPENLVCNRVPILFEMDGDFLRQGDTSTSRADRKWGYWVRTQAENREPANDHSGEVGFQKPR